MHLHVAATNQTQTKANSVKQYINNKLADSCENSPERGKKEKKKSPGVFNDFFFSQPLNFSLTSMQVEWRDSKKSRAHLTGAGVYLTLQLCTVHSTYVYAHRSRLLCTIRIRGNLPVGSPSGITYGVHFLPKQILDQHSQSLSVKGNPELFWRRVLLVVRIGCLSHVALGKSFFTFSHWYCDVWTVAKIKNQSCNFFRDFYPWTETFACRNRKWVDQKIWRKVVSGYLTKEVAFKIVCFWLFSFVPEKPHVDPKKHCFWDRMSLGRWVDVEFLRSWT